MDLSKIIITETSDEQVIVLKESAGERAFPIVIGIWEAIAINRYVNRQKTPRPMTHDLMGNMIKGLGFALERVLITDLKDGVFYARLMLKRDGKTIEVDSRPSDAIALAVQLTSPIYVEDSVLEDVCKSNESGFQTGEPDEDEGNEGEEEKGDA